MKILKKTILSILCAFILFWMGSIAICEFNTFKYGDIFRNTEIQDIGGIRYLTDEKIKVIECSNNYAKVYSVFENELNKGGDIYCFKCNNNNWEFDRWETVWSKMGSADGFIWPYIR